MFESTCFMMNHGLHYISQSVVTANSRIQRRYLSTNPYLHMLQYMLCTCGSMSTPADNNFCIGHRPRCPNHHGSMSATIVLLCHTSHQLQGVKNGENVKCHYFLEKWQKIIRGTIPLNSSHLGPFFDPIHMCNICLQ